MGILAPDVALVSDGGGLAPAPRKTIFGMDLVARALVTFAGRMPEDPSIEFADVNGGPAIVVRSGKAAAAVVMLYLVDGAVEEIHLITNPEKLRAV
jgi:hypothetical protein